MKTARKRLSKTNAIYTPASGATTMINYSEVLKKLEVAFTNGKVYHYLEVEQEKWEAYKSEIENGGSSGEFVNKRIKPFYEVIEVE
jgi:hypothetical protein